jgi:hypothetical protein
VCEKSELPILSQKQAALQPGMVFTSLTFSIHSSSKKWRETYNARIPPKGTHLLGKGKKETQHNTKGPSNFSRRGFSRDESCSAAQIKVRLLNQTQQTLYLHSPIPYPLN